MKIQLENIEMNLKMLKNLQNFQSVDQKCKEKDL